MDAQIARQRRQIEVVMAALVTVPGSKALGARLATEEAKVAQLEAERDALTDQRPKVMPHPALIARYVDDLLTTLDTDIPKARAILMRVLRPFPLTPDGDSTESPGPSTFRLSWAPRRRLPRGGYHPGTNRAPFDVSRCPRCHRLPAENAGATRCHPPHPA
jgi:hypothetical protein